MPVARWACVLAVTGCAGTTVAYDVAPVRGPYGMPVEDHTAEPAGHCEASVRIRVIDDHYAAVVGARVVVHRAVTAMAVEENLGVVEYRAHPVLTDAHGFAHVCSPDDLPPRSPWEGIGGGFTMRHQAQLDVFDDRGHTATIYEPFVSQIVLKAR